MLEMLARDVLHAPGDACTCGVCRCRYGERAHLQSPRRIQCWALSSNEKVLTAPPIQTTTEARVYYIIITQWYYEHGDPGPPVRYFL